MTDSVNMVERLNIQLPQSTKEILKKLAAEHGTDLTGYLNAVVFKPLIDSYHERTNRSNSTQHPNSGRNESS